MWQIRDKTALSCTDIKYWSFPRAPLVLASAPAVRALRIWQFYGRGGAGGSGSPRRRLSLKTLSAKLQFPRRERRVAAPLCFARRRPIVIVTMVKVGIMRVGVHQTRVEVPMGVGLANRIERTMRMLMMGVVDMPVRVFDRLVHVQMIVALG